LTRRCRRRPACAVPAARCRVPECAQPGVVVGPIRAVLAAIASRLQCTDDGSVRDPMSPMNDRQPWVMRAVGSPRPRMNIERRGHAARPDALQPVAFSTSCRPRRAPLDRAVKDSAEPGHSRHWHPRGRAGVSQQGRRRAPAGTVVARLTLMERGVTQRSTSRCRKPPEGAAPRARCHAPALAAKRRRSKCRGNARHRRRPA